MADSLYVHIPFCAHICGYCDFTKVLYQEEWAFSYVDRLIEQLDGLGINKPLKTVYVGGGTPSSLPSDLLKKVLSKLSTYLDKSDYEFTIEANPENLNEEKLLIMRECGVNRLSIGVESSHLKFLKLMGRAHTFEEAKEKVELAKKCGFTNITCDLIYGLPTETLEDVKQDVVALLSLDVPHLSTYCLSVNPGTSWHNKGYKEMDDEGAANQYDLILNEFRKAGYKRYEVSNFSKPGYESRHNLTYWHDEEYYAAGLGASGYLNGERFTFTKNLLSYLKGDFEGERETLVAKDLKEEFFLTNLRLEEGFSLENYEKRFGSSFLEDYKERLEKLKFDSLLVFDGNRVHCTDKGILLLDRVLLSLFK